jgi:hypothetical protein
MPEFDAQDSPDGKPSKRIRLRIAIAWGLFIGILSFWVGSISNLSANPIIELVQRFLMILLLPGLIGAGAVTGNLHVLFLAPAAAINALIHFGICWLFFPLLVWFGKTLRP